VDDWKRWPSQFARDRKVSGKGGFAVQGHELFVISNTCLVLSSGRGGESVPKELRSRAFKADIGLPEWGWWLEGS